MFSLLSGIVALFDMLDTVGDAATRDGTHSMNRSSFARSARATLFSRASSARYWQFYRRGLRADRVD